MCIELTVHELVDLLQDALTSGEKGNHQMLDDKRRVVQRSTYHLVEGYKVIYTLRKHQRTLETYQVDLWLREIQTDESYFFPDLQFKTTLMLESDLNSKLKHKEIYKF